MVERVGVLLAVASVAVVTGAVVPEDEAERNELAEFDAETTVALDKDGPLFVVNNDAVSGATRIPKAFLPLLLFRLAKRNA